MLSLNRILATGMMVAFSLLIIEDYYPELVVFDYVPTWVLIIAIITFFISNSVTSRDLKKDGQVRSEKTSFSMAIYLMCLWVLLNVLPGNNPDAALSFEGELFPIVIVLIFLFLEVHQFFEKRNKLKKDV